MSFHSFLLTYRLNSIKLFVYYHDIYFIILFIETINGVRDFVSCPCDKTHPLCFSFPVPKNDTKLANQDQTCFEMTRASHIILNGTAEQLNFLTSFIDASQVYGVDEETSNLLRNFTGGLLATSEGPNGEEYLPLSEDQVCDPRNGTLKCFINGDTRGAENLALTSVHMTFMREHNSLARRLSQLNPHWDDERLFQEARRINVAEIQHIVYNEWLPVLVGEDELYNSELKPLTKDYFSGYDEDVNIDI